MLSPQRIELFETIKKCGLVVVGVALLDEMGNWGKGFEDSKVSPTPCGSLFLLLDPLCYHVCNRVDRDVV